MATDVPGATGRERRFYLISAALAVAVTAAGFARTYYLRSYFHSPQLRPFLHFHGAVMTAWIVLFMIQVVLIARRNIRFHRVLGYFGVILALGVVCMGCSATTLAAIREVRAHSSYESMQLNVLGLELTQMLLFAVFVGIAVGYRRNTALHKRFMLLGTLCMMPNPQVRLMPFFHSNLPYLIIWTVEVFLIVGIDAYRHRRIHPAFFRGAVIANVALYLAQFIATTEGWRRAVSRLVA
ncbi:MAG: hypothetical protein JST28_02235 [Acidobacteria bacterium]|nr:hypothetical protein [Acidobacteriota bacterium]